MQIVINLNMQFYYGPVFQTVFQVRPPPPPIGDQF